MGKTAGWVEVILPKPEKDMNVTKAGPMTKNSGLFLRFLALPPKDWCLSPGFVSGPRPPR